MGGEAGGVWHGLVSDGGEGHGGSSGLVRYGVCGLVDDGGDDRGGCRLVVHAGRLEGGVLLKGGGRAEGVVGGRGVIEGVVGGGGLPGVVFEGAAVLPSQRLQRRVRTFLARCKIGISKVAGRCRGGVVMCELALAYCTPALALFNLTKTSIK